MLFLLAGLAGVIYGVTKGFSFSLVIGGRNDLFSVNSPGPPVTPSLGLVYGVMRLFCCVIVHSLGVIRVAFAFLVGPDCMDCRWRDNLAFYRRSHETRLWDYGNDVKFLSSACVQFALFTVFPFL